MNRITRLFYGLCNACEPNRSRTVRLAFPFMAVAALLGAAVATTDDGSYVSIVPSTTTVEAGEQFSIDVYAYATEPVNAVNISLQFPSDQVQVLGVDIGQSVITIWTQDPYVQGNKVVLSGGTFRNGFKGKHLIATINVKTLETGLAQFSAKDIKLLAGDGSGDPVSVKKSSSESLSVFVIDESTDVRTIAAEFGIQIVTDVDGDGGVSLTDVSIFMAAWVSQDTLFDFNGDGKMTFRDFSIILADTFLQ